MVIWREKKESERERRVNTVDGVAIDSLLSRYAFVLKAGGEKGRFRTFP